MAADRTWLCGFCGVRRLTHSEWLHHICPSMSPRLVASLRQLIAKREREEAIPIAFRYISPKLGRRLK